ncbi:glycosyltransferase family 25 protein [Stakelama saccharophila]|uniref:Glycosyltransferase family 25 protein n=1 Tax=Stakelama saccharophila TaxID=3075605 RepID=A0ABZ0BCE3_9SPHN|nr:glycosyltransferase family 25 protein [Stakelama sp. W311]WNO54518.1 glycosyltransferase family 25 protein [Stakelama sp. W311]
MGGGTDIVVLSMANAADRRDQFAGRASAATVPWRFFDAHTALDPDLIHDPDRLAVTHGRTLRPGELGCYSSHYAIWRDLLASDARQYIVLEDDIIADWQKLARIAEHDFAADGYHYVRLYQKQPSRQAIERKAYPSRGFTLVRALGKVWGTQGYVVTRTGAAALMRACRHVERPIDDQMDRFWEHGIPTLSLHPFPIIETDAASSIGDERFEPRPAATPARKAFMKADYARRRRVLARFYLRRAAKRLFP